MPTDPWIKRLLEPARIRFLCLGIFLVTVVLLIASFWTSDSGRTLGGSGPPLGNDFGGIYSAALRLNQSSSTNLYDFAAQDHVYHQLFAKVPATETLPYVHPPFVAWLFRPLALLPFPWAFAAWLAISAALYLFGLRLALSAASGFPRSWQFETMLLALAFEPFIMESWLGGQLACVGFACMALALACQSSGRPLAAGLALGLCLYKPTLLLLIVPMLILGRSWRTLTGFVTMAACLAILCIAGVGWQTTASYLHATTGFARAAAGGEALQLRLWKYVDLNHCLLLFLGGRTAFHWMLFAILAAGPLAWLGWSWWRSGPWRPEAASLTWAATLTWTPILNLYAGVYDTLIVVPAAIVVLAMAARDDAGRWSPRFRTLVVLSTIAYVMPWISQPIARALGIQLYTLSLAALGLYQLGGLGREERKSGGSQRCGAEASRPPAETAIEGSHALCGDVVL